MFAGWYNCSTFTGTIFQQSLVWLFNSRWHVVQQSPARFFHGHWHDCSTVTDMNFQKLLAQLFNTTLQQSLAQFINSQNNFFCAATILQHWYSRSSRPEVFLGKEVLTICSKFTGQHSCRSVISIKLESNFIEITLQHWYSPVNLLHIFRTPFLKNTSGWLLLVFTVEKSCHVPGIWHDLMMVSPWLLSILGVVK